MMGDLDALPGEILAHITSFLQNGSLHALSLTNRVLAKLAFQQMYTRTILPKPMSGPDDWGHRFLQLARTLIARPDLAAQVSELDVSLHAHEVPNSAKVFPSGTRAVIIPLLRTSRVDVARITPQWVELLRRARPHAWFGLLLYLVPKLRSLTAHFYDYEALASLRPTTFIRTQKSAPGFPYDSAFFDDMFGERISEVHSIPGLRKLQDLEIHASSAD